jgi:ribosomal protein L7/L12
VDQGTLLRLRRLEEQVALLSARAGVPWDDGTSGAPPQVVALLREGKTIQAIKAYRDATGVGLAEAKEAVERLRV